MDCPHPHSRRRRKRFRPAVLPLICLFASAAAGAQQTVPLTVVSGYPPTALWIETFLTHFIPEADRLLGAEGRYAIDWNTPFGSLTRPSGAFEAVQYGVADIGIITTPFHSDKIPFYNISYVTPFVTTDIGLVVRTVSELHDRFPALRESWSDYRQVYLVAAGLVDTYQALMNRPIDSLGDFRGRRMSGIGMNLLYFEGLDAVGIPSPLVEFYSNLSTGLTDGAIVWPEAIVSYKLYEVGPYLVDARLGAVSSVALSANQRAWNRLPAEVRDALLAAAVVYRDALALETVRRSNQAMASFQSLGGTIIPLTDDQRREWAATVPDLAATWAADMERRGLPGHALLSAYMDTMRANDQPIMRHWDQE